MSKARHCVSLFLCVSILFGLTGCGGRLFASRATNPVLEDYVGTWPNREVATLATKAAHRVNVVRMNDGEEVSEEKWLRGEFCTEPPPDAMESVAAAFGARINAALEATEPRTGITEKAAGELAFYRNLTTVMAPLLRRSQGLQWSRDILSQACNAYLNRRISKQNYLMLVTDAIGRSENVIMAEINNLPQLDYSFSGPLPVPGQRPAGLAANAAITKCHQAKVTKDSETAKKLLAEAATKDKEAKVVAVAEAEKKVKAAEETLSQAKAAATAKPDDTDLVEAVTKATTALEEAKQDKEKKENAAEDADQEAKAATELHAQATTAANKTAAECAIAKGQVALIAAEAEAAKKAVDNAENEAAPNSAAREAVPNPATGAAKSGEANKKGSATIKRKLDIAQTKDSFAKSVTLLAANTETINAAVDEVSSEAVNSMESAVDAKSRLGDRPQLDLHSSDSIPTRSEKKYDSANQEESLGSSNADRAMKSAESSSEWRHYPRSQEP